MGLISNILSVYKADTSDHKAKIKELSGEQKKAAEAELKGLEDSNRALDSKIKKFEQYGTTLAAIGVGIKVALDLAEFSGKKADLTAAAAGVSIEGLRKSTLGLRTDMELLSTAAKLNHSVFRLNQDQMELAGRAMTALGERGGDAEEAINAVTDALVTGKTKGLKQYGIEIDETKDKTAKLNDILLAFTKVSGEVSESSLDASDSISQSKVSFANMFDEVKDGLGNVVMALAPLISALAQVVGLVGKIANPNLASDPAVAKAIAEANAGPNVADIMLGRTEGDSSVGTGAWGSYVAQGYSAQHALTAGAKLNANLGRAATSRSNDALIDSIFSGARGLYDSGVGVAGQFGRESGLTKDPWNEAGKKGKGGVDRAAEAAARSILHGAIVSEARNSQFGKLDGGGGYGEAADGGGSYTDEFARHALSDSFADSDPRKAKGYGGTGGKAYAAFQSSKSESKLASMFGPIEEFNAYKTAFDTLGGAVGSALGAWVDGSMSAGKAFKKFIGEALKGLASQMAIESLKHAAYALGSLAMYDYAGAGRHAAAAAAFGLGAAAAAVGARALGAGGGAAAGGGARASAPNMSGGAGGGAPAAPVIVYSDAFAEGNARSKQLQAQKMFERAYRTDAVVRG